MPVDVARIALVCAPTVEPIELTKAYASHSEVVERIAKLKMFLRAHGWLPIDEREQEARSSGQSSPGTARVASSADEPLEEDSEGFLRQRRQG
jgi:hypothetical protein